MIERIGIDTSEDKWFCFDSNYLEGALGLIRELCVDNKQEKKYGAV